MSAVVFPEFVCLPQALAYICTRDWAAASALSELDDTHGMRSVMLGLLAKESVAPSADELPPMSRQLDIPPEDAVAVLQELMKTGHIALYGHSAGSGEFEPIRPQEITDLELRLSDADGTMRLGLWSRVEYRMAWTNLRCTARDLHALSPPPQVKKRSKVVSDILALWRCSVDRTIPLTKDEFHALYHALYEEKLGGKNNYAFEKAWCEIPADQKRRPGQHGQRKHPH